MPRAAALLRKGVFSKKIIIWGIKILFMSASGRKNCRPWLCQRKRQPPGGAHGVELFRPTFSAKFFGKLFQRTFFRISVATNPILSTQRIPHSRDEDFIYTNFSRDRALDFVYTDLSRGRLKVLHIHLEVLHSPLYVLCSHFRMLQSPV